MVLNKSVAKAFLNALNSKSVNYKEFIHIVRYLWSVVLTRHFYIPRIRHSLELTAKKKSYYKTVFKILAEYTSNSNIGIINIGESKILIKDAGDVIISDSEKDRIHKFVAMGMIAVNSESLIDKIDNINITYNNELGIARFFIRDRDGASEFIFSDFKVKEIIPVKGKTIEQVMDVIEHPLHIDFHSHIKRVLNYNLLQGINVVYATKDYKKTLAFRFGAAAKQLNKVFNLDINTFIDWDIFLVKTHSNIILNEIGDKEMIKAKISDIVPMDIVEASALVVKLKKLDTTIELDVNVYNVLTSKVIEIRETTPDKKNAAVSRFETFVPYLNSFLRQARLAIMEDSLPVAYGTDVSRVFKLDLRRGL